MWFNRKPLDPTPPEEKAKITRLVKENEVRVNKALQRRKETRIKNNLGPSLLRAMENR